MADGARTGEEGAAGLSAASDPRSHKIGSKSSNLTAEFEKFFCRFRSPQCKDHFTAYDTFPAAARTASNPQLTAKVSLLLCMPFAVTMTGPVVAPVGTVALIWVLLQLVIAAVLPLKVTDPFTDP